MFICDAPFSTQFAPRADGKELLTVKAYFGFSLFFFFSFSTPMSLDFGVFLSLPSRHWFLSKSGTKKLGRHCRTIRKGRTEETI